jgi:isoleucyl-tRNA synthetase
VENDLPLDNPVDGRGVYLDGTALVGGMHIYKANDLIVETMQENGTLLRHEPYSHSYPHCWRHHSPLIFRATPQWFIDMDQANLRESALAAIRTVEWIPGWGQQRIEGMVAGRPDWCVSRQRTWGVPITLFSHKDTGELHPDMPELLETIAQRIEKDGIEAWFELDPAELLGDAADEYEKATDTMDVWMDSGMVHHCVAPRWPDRPHPVELYLEGSDQHRGWFQSSLLTSVAMHGRAPYRQVLTHGFTVDEKGHKMSKSLGNIISPQSVFNSLGADVLRLWVAATDYRGEMSASDEILKRTSDAYRRIRNTARFLLGNLDGFDPAEHAVDMESLVALDRWAISRARELQVSIADSYDKYEFHRVYQQVHNFCVLDMGGYYLDVIKDRLYTTGTDSHPRRSAQTAMYHIVEAMVRWIAPILSFTAEEIWQLLPGDRGDSVLLSTWHEIPELAADDIQWTHVMEVREQVGKELEVLRDAGTIGSGLEAVVSVTASGDCYDALAALGEELRFVFITSDARVEAGSAGEDGGFTVTATASDAEKCVRCWHRRADIGANGAHPEICKRCAGNVDGPVEERRFA